MTSDRKIRRVLVLGSEGFLGRAIRAHCREVGVSVEGIDRGPGEGVEAVRSGVDAALRRDPDAVFHAAGLVGAGTEAEFEQAHVGSTEMLLEAVAARAPGARTIVLGSAAELGPSGGPTRLPEQEAGAPQSAYGRSKLRQSDLARAFARDAGLDLLRVRLFNTLGPGQGGRLVGGAMVQRLEEVLRRGDEALTVFDPESVRDFLDVRDVARCLLALAAGLPPDPDRPPVNVCSEEGLSVAGLAGELLAATGADVKLTWEVGQGPPTRVVGSCPTLRKLMGERSPRRVDTLKSLRDMWTAQAGQEVPR